MENVVIINAYRRLASAVLDAALEDYRSLKSLLEKHPGYHAAQHDLNEVLRFFKSEWGHTLSSLSGVILPSELQSDED